MKHCSFLSPFGEFWLCSQDDSLIGVLWNNKDISSQSQIVAPTENPALLSATTQLSEYFQGRRKTFNLPLKLQGTDFQKTVWHTLTTIPFGTTFSYSELANQIHNPKACRAVGLANSKNKLAIIIPCHRVIGKNGSLTGFAGGMDLKSQLLKFESQI